MIARGIALFFAGLCLLAFLPQQARSDELLSWWLDLRELPDAAGSGALVVLFVSYAAIGLGRGHRSLALVAGLAALIGLRDTVGCLQLRSAGVDLTGLPASLLLALLQVPVLCTQLRRKPGVTTGRVRRAFGSVLCAGLLAAVFPLLQISCFGGSDYRRPSDVAIVFGSRCYANGEPSRALRDRIDSAVDLYHQGLVQQLFLSGGPGDGDVHESEAMRRRALDLGVPDSALVLDYEGLDSLATVRNSCRVFPQGTRLARRQPRFPPTSHQIDLPARGSRSLHGSCPRGARAAEASTHASSGDPGLLVLLAARHPHLNS